MVLLFCLASETPTMLTADSALLLPAGAGDSEVLGIESWSVTCRQGPPRRALSPVSCHSAKGCVGEERTLFQRGLGPLEPTPRRAFCAHLAGSSRNSCSSRTVLCGDGYLQT